MSQPDHKQTLQTELDKVESELETIAKQDESTGDWVAVPPTEEMINADQNVEADVNEEWNERRAVLAQLEIRYRNIKRALNKFEDGSYGLCEISGEPIENDRLTANPAARTNLANMDREKELPL